MIFGLLYFCVVILCVNRSRSSFILYRIVKRHSRQSNVRRIWTCADNARQEPKQMDVCLCILSSRTNCYVLCVYRALHMQVTVIIVTF